MRQFKCLIELPLVESNLLFLVVLQTPAPELRNSHAGKDDLDKEENEYPRVTLVTEQPTAVVRRQKSSNKLASTKFVAAQSCPTTISRGQTNWVFYSVGTHCYLRFYTAASEKASEFSSTFSTWSRHRRV